MTLFNIYCDESCHLEHDVSKVMVLGAVWCPEEKAHEIAKRIRELKAEAGLARWYEVKWTKVSPSKREFYLRLIDYFFDDDDLHFRAVVIPDKSLLRHGEFAQNHDTFYYKTYYTLIKNLLSPEDRFNIYLDIKDTNSRAKEVKLHDVLCNSLYDRERTIIRRLQSVRSHEVEQVQLADVLTGVVTYANRELSSSAAKLSLVKKMKERSGNPLTRTTLVRASKVNILIWEAQ